MKIYGLDDDSSPVLRLESWCHGCNAHVSTRIVDVSDGEPTVAEAEEMAAFDAALWRDHLRLAHGAAAAPDTGN